MPQAILLHGSGGSSKDYFWFQSIQGFLEKTGYTVWWPLLPNTDAPDREDTVAFLEKCMPPPEAENIVIAHSSGCPLFLSYLERNDVHVGHVFFVSGFYIPVRDRNVSHHIIQKSYDFQIIASRAKTFTLINSDNDPWGCDDIQARPVALALSATLCVLPGEGHMGSAKYQQSYREFPFLEALITYAARNNLRN